MHTKELPIAVVDSGVGGISVLRELVRLMPGENYLYYGDSANAPYGMKTTQQVRELTLSVADMLIQRGIKALVVACNTATAAAIDALREKYPDCIIVGIEPALKMAADWPDIKKYTEGMAKEDIPKDKTQVANYLKQQAEKYQKAKNDQWRLFPSRLRTHRLNMAKSIIVSHHLREYFI